MKTRSETGRDTHAYPGPSTGLVVQSRKMSRAELTRRFLLRLVVLAFFWALLTDFRSDALVFGLPAVLAAAALVFLGPAAPNWQLSLRGAVAFVLWFAVQSVRGAIDVARRAFTPSLPLHPGFRAYRTSLPEGAPRILFLNTITLLPGTLSAEIMGEDITVHMLDIRADLEADLHDLERRVATLFALKPETKAQS